MTVQVSDRSRKADKLKTEVDMAQEKSKAQEKSSGPKVPEKPTEVEFLDAVARIYRRYGNDLSQFQRDVESDLEKRDDATNR